MRTIEPVLREMLHEVEQGVRDARVHPVPGGAGDEGGPLPGHLLGELLAHGLAEHVGASEAVPRELAGDLHHLLLVQDHPVGGSEDGLHQRVEVGDLGPPLLALDEVVHHAGLERSRPEQRDEGDDVLETARLQAPHELAHAPRFELEHPGGGARTDELVSLGVVGRHRAHVEGRLAGTGRIDHRGGAIDDGQGLEPEEVELHEAHRLDVVLVELGHRRSAVRVTEERRVVGERPRGDDHSPRVAARVACEPLERPGEVDEGAHVLVALVVVPERGLLRERPFEGDPEIERDELCDHVHERKRESEHPTHVAHHGLRRHRAEGDDLRHPVRPVAPDHVLDHAVAPVHAEVDVEVGHRDPFGIQKALEEEVIGDGIDVGNAQSPGRERPGAGTASGSDRHPVRARPGDEVRDDEVVAGEPQLHDHLDLVFEPFAIRGRIRLVLEAPFEAGASRYGESLLGALAGRDRERGQVLLSELDLDAASAGDLQGVLDRLRNVRETVPHLVRASKILALGVAARPGWVAEDPPLLDADPSLVRLVVAGGEEAHVVRRDHRHPALGREADGIVEERLLPLPPEALEPEVVAIPEPGEPLVREALRERRLAAGEGLTDRALPERGYRDEPIGLRLAKPGERDRSLALDVRPRQQSGELAVALRVAAEQNEPVRIPRRRRDQDVRPHDGLDPRPLRLPVELDERKEVGRLGNRHRRHALRPDRLDKGGNADHAVDERILRMHHQVHEPPCISHDGVPNPTELPAGKYSGCTSGARTPVHQS